jgi:hypothetical protein
MVINAPTPLSNQTVGSGTLVFPNDLLSITSNSSSTAVASGSGYSNSSTGFYSQFQFVSANTILPASALSSMGMITGQSFGSGGNVYLPLPSKIHDVQLNLWSDVSFLDYVPSLAGSIAGLVGQSTNTTSGNPFAYMLYKQPLFKEWIFQWILAPNNPDESSTLLKILYSFKTAQLPAYSTTGLALLYPYLVYVRLNPNQFMMDFKPCAIISVEIDFSGSGHSPAFFNDGSPAIVSFTLHLKECQIQVRSDVADRGGTMTDGMITAT